MKKVLFLVLPFLALVSCNSEGGGIFFGGGEGGGGFNPFGGGGDNTSAPASEGRSISATRASQLANEISIYLQTYTVTKARVETWDFETDTMTGFTEFDDSVYAAYQWSVDSNSDGEYTFIEGNKAYYFYEDPNQDYERPNISKWYITYDIDQSSNYINSDFTSRYYGLSSVVKGMANTSISGDFDDSPDASTRYYSSGSGHLKIETSYAGLYRSIITEYRDYKPYRLDLFGLRFNYDFGSVSKPDNRAAYTQYAYYQIG